MNRSGSQRVENGKSTHRPVIASVRRFEIANWFLCRERFESLLRTWNLLGSLTVEETIDLYRQDGRPLPPPTSGRDFANKMQDVV